MLDIHRTLLLRLLISWLAISLVIGGGVFYYGVEKIDDKLVGVATAESAKVTAAGLALINAPVAKGGLLDHLASDFMRAHFVVVEFYDRDHKKVLEEVNPNFVAIEQHLKQHPHAFPVDGRPHYERFRVDQQTVLQVMVPLKDASGKLAGFFEGVFAVDAETLAGLQEDLVITLVTTLLVALLTTLVLYPVILTLNRDVVRFSRDLLRSNVELMEVLGSAIAKRDSDTNIHNYRVAIYAVKLAETAKLDATRIRDLIGGAFLHDVGKIGISDSILLKPARLDEREFAAMKTHVAIGVDIIEKSNWLQQARDVVEFHHEKYDGNGYLKGLRGEDIPLTARIFAIVDVFDALTSKRP
ncbi:MAG: HD domain-containing protein, partial [Rhodocyclales bacterium]|nr:HD domain-containing protein [Rhodocyclales bacterium]